MGELSCNWMGTNGFLQSRAKEIKHLIAEFDSVAIRFYDKFSGSGGSVALCLERLP